MPATGKATHSLLKSYPSTLQFGQFGARQGCARVHLYVAACSHARLRVCVFAWVCTCVKKGGLCCGSSSKELEGVKSRSAGGGGGLPLIWLGVKKCPQVS